MKEKYVTQYGPNESLDEQFLVIRKEIRPKKNGGEYLFTVLGDRSGHIPAFMWDNVDVFRDLFNVDDYVNVVGVTKEYNQSLQFTLHKIRRLNPENVELFDFIPASDRDLDALFDEFMDIIQHQVTDPYLHQLLINIFSEETIARRFRQCPAAKALHHAYIGGLLEHTLSVMKFCLLTCDHYPFIHRSLLLAGAVLHDFGKIFELSWGKSFDYTDQGRLLGHITMAAIHIDRRIQEIPDFPHELRMELLHLILAHHGQLEFGSPKRPKTMEALALSYIDDLDAKIQSFREAIDQGSEKDIWTPFNQTLQRFLYRKRYEETRQGADPDPEASDVQ